MSNNNETNVTNTSDIQSNLAGILKAEENSVSKDSSINDIEGMLSDEEEEIIKDLPKDEVAEDTNNENGSDAMFTAKVIERLHHNDNREVSDNIDNLFVDEVFDETCHEFAVDAQFKDVPSVLVDDDDSVLFPSDNISCVEEETDKTKREIEMKRIREENKARVRLCKTLLGNGIIDIFQLETKMTTNLLCLQCVKENRWDGSGGDTTNECGIVVRAIQRGFACTLTVQCVDTCSQWNQKKISKQYSDEDDAKET